MKLHKVVNEGAPRGAIARGHIACTLIALSAITVCAVIGYTARQDVAKVTKGTAQQDVAKYACQSPDPRVIASTGFGCFSPYVPTYDGCRWRCAELLERGSLRGKNGRTYYLRAILRPPVRADSTIDPRDCFANEYDVILLDGGRLCVVAAEAEVHEE
jgi:hypothetical protein